MGMKSELFFGAAVLALAASGAIADDRGRGAGPRDCGDKSNPCPVIKAAEPITQPDYPFSGPKDLPDPDLEKLREGVVKENLGTMLGPGDIGAVNNQKLDAQGANAYPGYAGASLPSARRRDISYVKGPQQGPEELWLAQNIPSPISFQDQYGNPWPIASIAYDPRIYSVNGQGCGANNAPAAVSDDRPTFIMVTPCKFWTWGSFSVQLQGINTPVVFVAGSGADEKRRFIDVPVLVHVEGLSPTGKKPKPVAQAKRPHKPAETGPSSAYQAFLSGTPPQGATRMSTSDGNADAWLYQGSLYLVAPYKVITPDYEAIASGNNRNIFRFGAATSRVLASAADGSERVISIGY